MRKLRRILAVFLVVGIISLIPIQPCLAIDNPDSITLGSAKVFQNVFENGDMLFVVLYDVEYASEPTEDAGDAFLFNLYNGSTLIGQRQLNYYRYNVISMYYDATDALALTWGAGYKCRITGNPALFTTLTEGVNMVTYTLGASNWITGTMTESRGLLRIHCLDLAELLQADWGFDLIVTTVSGTYLNSDGRTTFLDAIPGLDTAIPNLFQMSSGSMVVDWNTNTGAYQTELAMGTKAGTKIAAAFTGIGTYIGVSGQTAAGLFMCLIALMVIGIVFFYSGNTIAAMVLSIPIVIMGNWLGLVPLVITWVAAMIVVLYFMYHIWLRGV